MKITDKRLGEPKCFEDINYGQVFLDEDGCYWIRIHQIDGFENAAALDDGAIVNFNYTDKVYPVEAELIIK